MHRSRFVILGILLVSALLAGLFIPAGTAFVMEGEQEEPFVDLLITEVLSNPSGSDDQEWIEIGNLGTTIIDVASLTLQSGTKKFVPLSELLRPGEHRRFPKTETKLTLANTGGSVSLLSGATILDSFSYPETAEEVSYGRAWNDSSQLRSFCLPTPGRPNTDVLLDPRIEIQSGDTQSIGVVTLNLVATVSSGSLASASCQWSYSDGYTSTSCNPPSHTFRDPGSIAVTLTVTTMCNEQIMRTLTGAVIADEIEAEVVPLTSRELSPVPIKEHCIPMHYTGAVINEFLPNPRGEDSLGEWIELRNTTDTDIDLCGWQLDDEASGSGIFSLDGFFIPAQGYLTLKRSLTGIALNNDKDSVRLFVPGIPTENPVPHQQVLYEHAEEGMSYMRTENSEFVWSPAPSENFENRMQKILTEESRKNIVVSAVLPHPHSLQEEWIEVTNVGTRFEDLTGWMLDNHTGGSEAFTMSGVVLAPAQTLRFLQNRTKIVFNDSTDLVQLLQPDGTVNSAFAWTEAEQGKIYRLPVLPTPRVPITITKVIDGETLGITIPNPDDLRLLPPSVRRHWLGSAIQDDPILLIHPLGLEMRKGSFAFLEEVAEGQSAYVEFEETIWNQNGKIQAYVTLESGASLERLLLQNGFASVGETPFIRRTEYALLEKPAEQTSVEAMEQSDTIAASFQKGIVISEIYPSPLTDEENQDVLSTEWIELFNPTEEVISLSGWSLDDIADSGSKAWKFPSSTILLPGEYVVFTKEQTKLALNNTGDDVQLILPDGTVSDRVSYGNVKKGMTIVVWEDELCVGTLPTPALTNVCSSGIASVPVQKSASTKKVSTGLRVKYENVLDEISQEDQTLSPMFENLKQLNTQSDTTNAESVARFDLLSALLGALITTVVWCLFPTILSRIRAFSPLQWIVS